MAFSLGGRERVLANDAAFVARFLQEAPDETRAAPINTATTTVTGDGLLSSVPPRWQPRRKVVQRCLAPRQVRRHLGLFADSTVRWLDGLVLASDVDLAAAVGDLTLQNLGDAVFDTDFRPLRPLLSRVLTGVLDTSRRRTAAPSTRRRSPGCAPTSIRSTRTWPSSWRSAPVSGCAGPRGPTATC